MKVALFYEKETVELKIFRLFPIWFFDWSVFTQKHNFLITSMSGYNNCNNSWWIKLDYHMYIFKVRNAILFKIKMLSHFITIFLLIDICVRDFVHYNMVSQNQLLNTKISKFCETIKVNICTIQIVSFIYFKFIQFKK